MRNAKSMQFDFNKTPKNHAHATCFYYFLVYQLTIHFHLEGTDNTKETQDLPLASSPSLRFYLFVKP